MTSLLIQHLITTTLLASLVWVVCRLANPAPAAKHILWSLVILKLLIPPMGEVGIGLPFLNTPAPQTAHNQIEPISMPTPQKSSPAIEAVTSSSPEESIPTANAMVSTSSTPSTRSTPATPPIEAPPTKVIAPINWPALAITAWLCGAFAMAALQLIRWQRFAAQTSVSAETPAWLREEAAAVANLLGCNPVPVTVCNRLSTPAVAGVLKPHILVPSALIDRLPRERWRALLAHELAHVKRRDTWWRVLELACGIVWFWNPVFWFARKSARTAAEHACDAWVVWALPNQRRAYADSLVDVSEWASTPNLPATAIGMSAASRAKLEARLNTIVLGSAAHRVSKPVVAIASLLLIAAVPGWALESKNVAEPDTRLQIASPPAPEPNPIVVAQQKSSKSRAASKPNKVQRALDEPITIEFDNEFVGTITEFISGYVDVNIVLDYSVIESKQPESTTEMEVVHVGPHWYKHARREYLGTREWPKSQVVDGMVGPFDGKVSSVMDALNKLLPAAGMTYAVTPDCIWITVARPQFEITDPKHQPETWLWHPVDVTPFREAQDKNGHNSLMLRNSAVQKQFKTDKVHIADIVQKIHDMYASQPMPDGNTLKFSIPPIIVDAAAIAPPQEGDLPKSYLIASDAIRSRSLFTGRKPDTLFGSGDLSKELSEFQLAAAVVQLLGSGVKRVTPATSGMVPFIKLNDVPLEHALTALLKPLNLTYVAQPEFIYITSPERAQNLNFDDRPVPQDLDELGKVLDEPTTIEFHDEYVGTILEFLSGYVGVNVVVDSRAVLPENTANYSATGRKPVTNGHIRHIHVNDLRLADTLKALLTPLNLDYAVEPNFIWISSPEYIAEDSTAAKVSVPPTGSGISATPAPEGGAPVGTSRVVQVPIEGMRRVEPSPKPRQLAAVESTPATVTRAAKKPGPTVDGYTFRRITRWEDSDARVEVEFGDGRTRWYENGDAFEHILIADIDVISNQVVIESGGELRVLQLSWPIEESSAPAPRTKRKTNTMSRWKWTPVPYGNVKFGPIARWENSDPRLQVEFANGQRKWLEVGDAVGNARIGSINIIANQVVVRTPENQTRTFDLPRPVQVPSATAPRAQRSTKQSVQPNWTPVDYGNVTIGRIARWEDSRDERVEIELPNGERKWLEACQSAAGITVVSIDILKNRVTVQRNGATEVVQLP